MKRVRLYNDGGYPFTLRDGHAYPVEVRAFPYHSLVSGRLVGFDVPVSELQRVFYGVPAITGTLYFCISEGECKEVVRCEHP